MSNTPKSSSKPAPLSEDQLVELGEANMRLRQFHRAARAARRAAVGLLVFGVLTAVPQFVPGAGFSLSASIMGLWMIAAGCVEYWGEQNILRLKPGVFKKLMTNQLLLGAMFIVISGWWMLEVALRGNAETAQLNHVLGPYMGAGAGNASQQIDQLATLCLYVMYGSVGAFGLICQGSMAIYYARRERMLQAYLTETPEWIIQIQQVQRMPGSPRTPMKPFRS